MDKFYILWILVLSSASFITVTKAQCGDGLVFEEGKCFDSLEVARNLVLEWQWNYLIDVELTPEIETYVLDAVTTEFVAFSEDMRQEDLGRRFCPDAACTTLEIEFRLISNNERLQLRFRLANVNNLLSESPPLLAPDALLQAIEEDDRFDLGPDNLLGMNGEANTYRLTSNARYCPAGSEILGSGNSALCGRCARGYYSHPDTQVCTDCEEGTYQSEAGQSACVQCDPPLSTVSTRSTSVDACILVCDEGTYLNTAGDTCLDCPIGTYQPSRGQSDCRNCSDGWTTFSAASVLSNRCLEPCDAGYSLATNGACEICPQGTFLTAPFSDRECSPCPTGLTTLSEGSTSDADCNAVLCDAGEQREGVDPGECVPCPFNSYKDADMALCESCGDDSMWRTDSDGSTSQDDCNFYCDAGYFVDDDGQSCEPCPHDSYKVASDFYAVSCTSCPDSAPKTASTGSTSQDSCQYARCDRGYEITAGDTLQCSICDHGFYQSIPEPIFQRCVACSDGTSTRQQGAVSSTQCEEFCESGYERTVLRECVPCGRGFYKDNSEGIEALFGECQQCPINFVTLSTASTSQQDCNVRNCSLGYYLDPVDNLCRICERGMYQDELYRESCKACPSETTTTGDGATSEQDCSVVVDRVRIAFRIKFDIEWRTQYFNPDSNLYLQLENRILKQADHALTLGVAAYRGELRLRSLSPGSVQAHLVAQFYSGDPDVEADLQQTLDDAVSAAEMSSQQVDGTDPIPIDPRASDPFAFGFTNRDLCPRGEQYNYDSAQCEECPVATYQLATLADVCLQCPTGYSTDDTGTVGEEAASCLLICEAGFEERAGVCRQCQAGFYKESAGIEACDDCVGSLITTNTGSTTGDDCIAPCPAGRFSNEMRQCEECPINTYNDQENQIECTPCDEFLMTVGTGASSTAQCVDECVGADPCQNSATCQVDGGGVVSCTCTSDFTGDRCESRLTTTTTATTSITSTVTTPTQPSTTSGNNTAGSTESSVSSKEDGGDDLLMYIAIGVPCAVVLIIVIIVAVACSRRNKKEDPNPEATLPKDIGPPTIPEKKNNIYKDIPMNGLQNQTYAPTSEDSFVVTTPISQNQKSSKGAASYDDKRKSKKDTVSSIPEVLAPEPPRSITTVNISSDNDEIRHRGSVAPGFDPPPDNFAMPTISNPLLQSENNNGSVFINGVATLPPAGGGHFADHPPPYSATEQPSRKNKKKKGRKSKNSKHVLIDTQRNMVHTFKSTHSDTSSAFASPNGVPPTGQSRSRPGLRNMDTVRSDGSGVYETIPGDALL